MVIERVISHPGVCVAAANGIQVVTHIALRREGSKFAFKPVIVHLHFGQSIESAMFQCRKS